MYYTFLASSKNNHFASKKESLKVELQICDATNFAVSQAITEYQNALNFYEKSVNWNMVHKCNAD